MLTYSYNLQVIYTYMWCGLSFYLFNNGLVRIRRHFCSNRSVAGTHVADAPHKQGVFGEMVSVSARTCLFVNIYKSLQCQFFVTASGKAVTFAASSEIQQHFILATLIIYFKMKRSAEKFNKAPVCGF